jgi:FkbM family methyltransferase
MNENISYFINNSKKNDKWTKNPKNKDKLKTILFISLILIIFLELFIILKKNNFIKNKLQEEKKYKNMQNEESIENEKSMQNIKRIEKNIKRIENEYYKKNKDYSKLLNFKSYAPLCEDIILFLFLYDIKTGFYIDVGANDPIKGSVTNFFYIRGWNGINIEPLNDKYILLKNKRPRDINLNIVAGQEKGNTTLYINKELTTTMKKYSSPRKPEKIVNVETMTDICKKYVPKGTIIEFCKIDVEGAERNVILGYDFINCRPKIFCIESTVPITMIPTYHLFEDILTQNNYSFIYQYDVNRFYVDNKSIFANILSQRVTLIDLFIEKYKIKKKRYKK